MVTLTMSASSFPFLNPDGLKKRKCVMAFVAPIFVDRHGDIPPKGFYSDRKIILLLPSIYQKKGEIIKEKENSSGRLFVSD